MSEPIAIGAEQMEQWLEQTANCTIPDRNLLALLETIEPDQRKTEIDSEHVKILTHKLGLGLNSYCHIYRIGHGPRAFVTLEKMFGGSVESGST